MIQLKASELNRLSEKEFLEAKKIPITLLLEDIRSAHNIGSCFRSADAFLIDRIILCGISPFPPHNQIHKTALGAQDTIKWDYYHTSHEAILKYKALAYEIIAIEQTHQNIQLQHFKIDKNKKYLLIFGNELNGIKEKTLELCDHSIEIPQFGTKHSLNISVCIGIIVWEFNKIWNL